LLQGGVGVAGQLLQTGTDATGGCTALRPGGQQGRFAATVLLAQLR